MTFVEGLDEIPQVPPGSVAVINKIHHAAIDGVSGADMMGVLLDMTRSRGLSVRRRHAQFRPSPMSSKVLSHTARKIIGQAERNQTSGGRAW